MQLIEGIAISKASGIDGINSRALKDCMRICSLEMTYLINMSLSSGRIPECWKLSRITPIPKDGNLRYAEN